MSALPKNQTNVIPITCYNGKLQHKNIVKYNKDGTVSKVRNNKIAGKDSEVYAFTTKEEISAMIKVLDEHITSASTPTQKRIACRNKLLFIIGINIGIRASDLRTLKWDFFFEKDKDNNIIFKEYYKMQPIKQRKYGKFVTLYFNQAVKQAIKWYIDKYPIDNLDSYLFSSRKGDEAVTVDGLCAIIKSIAAEAEIKKNIGSHSLRKTFGFWCWHEAADKEKALVVLQQIFRHSDTSTTAKYIGILNEEMEDMFNSISLGFEM